MVLESAKPSLPVRGGSFLPGSLFFWLSAACSLTVLAFILLPLHQMVSHRSPAELIETIKDPDVFSSIMLSLKTSMSAALISFVLGTPLAYILARTEFPGKRIVESVIDLPIMIPHPVVGIAFLSLAGKNHWIGEVLQQLNIRIMGSVTGIVLVLTFVGLPFYIDAAKAGFESVPVRLEKVSRSLGAGSAATFFLITFPLTWRHMLVGMIMCLARAVSEFGAVVIVAYHPMIAPVLMYERFTAYGLKYSQPVAVWLILLCLMLFVMLRLASVPRRTER